MFVTQTVLMCPPTYFGVSYVINPWMEGHIADTQLSIAEEQWKNLRAALERHAVIDIQPPVDGLPDMVFTANAGLVCGKKAVVSRFRNGERQGEEPYARACLASYGFEMVPWPDTTSFEGAGDALFDRGKDILWVGHGFRTDSAAVALLEKNLGCKAVGLKLVHPRFYHLDTCFCPLEGGYLLYYPPAFDEVSRAVIAQYVPEDKRLAVSEKDALGFCCNAVDLQKYVFMNDASSGLQARLAACGFTPVITPLSEFMKAGGAAKCLTLKLVDGPQASAST